MINKHINYADKDLFCELSSNVATKLERNEYV